MKRGAAATDERKHVHCVTEGAIGWLRIDNTARLNAMSLSMWRELGDGASRLGADPSIRVIVVTGEGGKAFCSGGDISEYSEHRSGEQAIKSYDAVGKAALDRLGTLSKPTIALIQGYCMGGGVAIALRCDLRMAADNARLGIPAAKLGLSYDFASIKRLVDLVGPSNAKHILYTGRAFSAEEAARQGLVNEVVAASDILAHVHALAEAIAANAPLSLSASKLIVEMTACDEQDRDLAACEAAERACLASVDYAEATRAFMEKRKPHFIGC